MSATKDELITGSELARRLKVDPSYINNKARKAKLKDAKCMFGKKFYYIKSCDFLGKNPDDPHKSRQSELQTEVAATKKPSKTKTKKSNPPPEDTNEPPEDEDENKDSDGEAKSLLDQIIKATKSKDSSINRKDLDLLRLKAGVLREYFTAKNEEIKNRKLEENLFERDEVIKILSFATSMVRNSLINLPNNYAVSLEGRDQKEIKDYVTDDINKILEDLQNVGNQFE